MHLPLVFRGTSGPLAVRPALQAALIVAAAMAGYVTGLPHFPASAAIDAAQPDWAGHIAPPEIQAQQPSAPVTSASYLAHEAVAATGAVLAEDSGNKSGAPAAVQKASAKIVMPPRRPPDSIDAAKSLTKATDKLAADKLVNDKLAADKSANRQAAAAPVSIAVPEAETKPQSRNLLSPVTDHLPAAGALMRPLHMVGDTFHNIIKSFC